MKSITLNLDESVPYHLTTYTLWQHNPHHPKSNQFQKFN